MLFLTNRFLPISVNVMAFEVVWHPFASIDYEEVMEYVCQNFGWAASKKLYDDVLERINVLSGFPKLGVQFKGITYQGNEIRILNIHQNAIVYAVGEQRITIIVFWNNHQNPVRLAKLIDSR